MRSQTIAITNDAGIPFNVVRVQKGDRYGRNGVLVHEEDDPLIEFYDARHAHAEHGQFVSRYYETTLLERAIAGGGLLLDGGVPEWQVSEENITQVAQWIVGLEAPEEKAPFARLAAESL